MLLLNVGAHHVVTSWCPLCCWSSSCCYWLLVCIMLLLMLIMLLLIVGVHHVVGFHHVQTIEVLTLLLVSLCCCYYCWNSLCCCWCLLLLIMWVHRVVSVHCVRLFSQVPSLLFNMLFFPFGFSITPILALSCTLEFHWRQKVNGCKVSTKKLTF
jgi:hypothetical protein